MSIEADEKYLDKLERRNRRRLLNSFPNHNRHTRVARKTRQARRGPAHGPPAPSGFRTTRGQAKAAEARVGLRNAARTAADKDDECDAVLEILQGFTPHPSSNAVSAFTAWVNTNNG